jgi:hypothetical protein
MGLAGITKCPSCRAIANVNWKTCLVCSHPLHGQPNWETAWRELVHQTNGIDKSDPRFLGVLNALEECDRTFAADDWGAFQRAVVQVKTCIEGRNP